MSNVYKRLPSSLLGINDKYTAFCFDEACAYIISEIEDGKQPKFKTHYKSFSDMYSNY